MPVPTLQDDSEQVPPSIERAASLRAAEKLLRIGKLDLAVKEYERLVLEDPQDSNTAIRLGTLYLRAGSIDKAIEQLTTAANALFGQGVLSEAASLYKTLLTIRAGNEDALMRLAEIASAEGQLGDARDHFTALEKSRTERGDTTGAAEIRIRIGGLDPNDLDARIVAAHARHEIGDVDGAVSEFKTISAEMNERGRHTDALLLLEQAAAYAPDDEDLRDCLFTTYLSAGDFAQARQAASTARHWKDLGLGLAKAGHSDAIDVLREAVRLNPVDIAIRARLSSLYIALGDAAGAASYLLPEMAGDDPALLLAVAEIQLRGGKTDSGVAIAQRVIEMDPSLLPSVGDLAIRVAAQISDASWPLLESAVSAWVRRSEWSDAVTALEAFAQRVPDCVPAVVRLVEIAIDGANDSLASRAQAQLADTYLARGMAAEAVLVIEDLAVRESDDRRHTERLQQALTMLGATHPEEAVARRLNALMALPDKATAARPRGDSAGEQARGVPSSLGSPRSLRHG